MEQPNYVLKKQEFYVNLGYSFEFAFVFSVLTAEEKVTWTLIALLMKLIDNYVTHVLSLSINWWRYIRYVSIE